MSPCLNSHRFNSHLSSIVLRIRYIIFCLHQSEFNIQFLWAPSHVRIRGNEVANNLAKSSSDLTSSSFSIIPWYDFTSFLRCHISTLQSDCWNKSPAIVVFKFKSIVPNIPNNIWFKDFLLHRSSIINFNRLQIGHYIFFIALSRLQTKFK